MTRAQHIARELIQELSALDSEATVTDVWDLVEAWQDNYWAEASGQQEESEDDGDWNDSADEPDDDYDDNDCS